MAPFSGTTLLNLTKGIQGGWGVFGVQKQQKNLNFYGEPFVRKSSNTYKTSYFWVFL